MSTTATGTKADGAKPDHTIIPLEVLDGVARVRAFGGAKYGLWNFQGGMPWRRPVAAALRHIFKWCMGEDHDPESGEHHLDHAITTLMLARYYTLHRPDLDDRPGGPAADKRGTPDDPAKAPVEAPQAPTRTPPGPRDDPAWPKEPPTRYGYGVGDLVEYVGLHKPWVGKRGVVRAVQPVLTIELEDLGTIGGRIAIEDCDVLGTIRPYVSEGSCGENRK